MIQDALRAFGALFTSPYRAVLFKSLALTLGLFLVLLFALEAVIGYANFVPQWAEVWVQVLSGVGFVIASIFLVTPVVSLIAAMYVDDIAKTVETRNYPNDAPGRPLPFMRGMAVSAKFALLVLLVMVLIIPLLFIPGVNWFAFTMANSYLLGREYFELAAMRHLPYAEAKALRKHYAARLFISGWPIAVMATIPVLNLLTPLFATTYMVHRYKSLAKKAGIRPDAITVNPAQPGP